MCNLIWCKDYFEEESAYPTEAQGKGNELVNCTGNCTRS